VVGWPGPVPPSRSGQGAAPASLGPRAAVSRAGLPRPAPPADAEALLVRARPGDPRRAVPRDGARARRLSESVGPGGPRLLRRRGGARDTSRELHGHARDAPHARLARRRP